MTTGRKTTATAEEKDEPLWSTILPHTSTESRGEIRRTWDPLVHPELGVHGCRTLYEGLRHGCRLNPLGPCMGYRAVSTTGFATPFIYSSYTECVARVDALAAGLETLDLVKRNEDGMVVLGLYMKNCMEWVVAEYATYCIGGTTAPLYDTLGPETVRFVLAQTGAKAVVSTRAELGKLCEAKKSGECPAFKYAILVDGVTPAAADMATAVGIEAISFAKAEAVGAQRIATRGHKHSPPSADDVATFCYTSGTTGDPKGALITHENFMSTANGVISAVPEMELHPYDRHLSYMPLAHIFERVIISQAIFCGASIAFYRGDPLLLVEDFQACRPTVLIAAPRVLNKIYDKIYSGIASAGGLKKKVFDACVSAKTDALMRRGQLKHALYDRLVFNKIKKGLGLDSLRAMVSGSAPISANVMAFFRCLLGIPIVEGYGQTEGTAGATIGHADDMSTVGHVGGPIGCCEIVLVDVPEMNYLHTDRMHRGQPCLGRGEIWVRGPNVFKGYYKDEQKTKEMLDEEGWLHSGDIGLWRPDGALQIIDRKKNIFKLSQGEYVAPEKIENILIRSPLIAQCFVYGDSFQSCLVAIVVPDEDPVRLWAESSSNQELAKESFEQICNSPSLKDAIMKDIQKLSKENGLHGFEMVRAIFVDSRPFAIENDMLTPTFKLKRQKVQEAYQKQIDELYAGLPGLPSKL